MQHRKTSSGAKVAGRDRMWFLGGTTQVVGPLVDLRADKLRQSLAELARGGSESRLFYELQPERACWRRTEKLQGFLETVVLEWDEEDPFNLQARLHNLQLYGAPWRAVICGPYFGLRAAHVFGDGAYLDFVLSNLARLAQGSTDLSPFQAKSRQYPLSLGLIGTARRPSAALASIKYSMLYPPAPASSNVGEAVQPYNVTVAYVRIDSSSGSPTVAEWVARAHRGFLDSGVAVGPYFYLLFSGRRFLSVDSKVEGNFVVPVHLHPQSALDADAIQLEIARVISSRFPLVAILVGSLRSLRTRLLVGHRPTRSYEEWTLFHSFRSKAVEYDALRWQSDARTIAVLVQPGAYRSSTLSYFRFKSEMHISVTSISGQIADSVLRKSVASLADVAPEDVRIYHAPEPAARSGH